MLRCRRSDFLSGRGLFAADECVVLRPCASIFDHVSVRRCGSGESVASKLAKDEELDAFVSRYVTAWWDSSLDRMRALVAPHTRRISFIDGNAFVLEFSEVVRQIEDKPPTPEADRRFVLEHAEILGPGAALIQLVLFGVDMYPLRRRLELHRDEAGDWRIRRGFEEAADRPGRLSPDAAEIDRAVIDALAGSIGSWRD